MPSLMDGDSLKKLLNCIMGVNKSAYIRYLAYDRCLTNTTRKYGWKDMVHAANQSLESHSIEGIRKAQFYRDIDALKAPPWLAPISSNRGFYSYTDSAYSIVNRPLNEPEAEQLKSALLVLTRFKGLPQFEWVNEIIPKMEKQFGLESGHKEIIGFDQNIDLKGLEHFDSIFNAIVNKEVMFIQYQSFKSPQPKIMAIHPYYLKQYNNRWFLFGLHQEAEKVYNIPLDRILSFEAAPDTPYVENKDTDFDEYFEDIVGVTKFDGVEPELIKLWFSAEQAGYIDTKPLHGTQKLKWQNDGSAIVSIQVIPNIELEHLLLRFGEKCIVLEPGSIRATIENRLSKALGNYAELSARA